MASNLNLSFIQKIALGAAGLTTVFVSYVLATARKPSRSITASRRQELVEKDGGFLLQTGGGRCLEYFEFGNIKAPTSTLLAIHGAQTTGKLFEILNEWATQHNVRVIAPTLPGFGLSPYYDFSFATWVSDIVQLLRHLDVNAFHVLGTSLGSIYAAALASTYPNAQAVQNVMLYVALAPAEPSSQNPSVHDPLQGSILAGFGSLRSRPLLKVIVDKWVFLPMLGMFMPRDSDGARSVRYQWEGASNATYVIYAPWEFDWHHMASHGSIGSEGASADKAPSRRVVIVSGSTDQAAPPHNQKRLHQLIEHSELIQYDGPHERAIVEPRLMMDHLDQLLGFSSPLTKSMY